jgi:hypothetical protein
MKETFDPHPTLHMEEAFDPPAAKPPETQNTTSSCMINNVMVDVLPERDAISSQRQCTRPADIPAHPHAISSQHPCMCPHKPYSGFFASSSYYGNFFFHSAGDGMKSQDDTDFLRHAHRTLSLLVRVYTLV